ncbi:hypothetical protein [Gymnodinialimonas sp. 57CJ19]|uniref:hypothetical protein n=1 Tax=Gymnodinialimonas sp. 57CJ19 TaxID=3138498 RepID=UPI00313449B2
MSDAALGTFLFLGPLYLICGLFLLWAWFSASFRLARTLRYSAIFWAVWLTLCFCAMMFAMGDCSGNWLYGFSQCTTFSADGADFVVTVAAISLAVGVLYGALLLGGGAIAEIVGRRRKP